MRGRKIYWRFVQERLVFCSRPHRTEALGFGELGLIEGTSLAQLHASQGFLLLPALGHDVALKLPAKLEYEVFVWERTPKLLVGRLDDG